MSPAHGGQRPGSGRRRNPDKAQPLTVRIPPALLAAYHAASPTDQARARAAAVAALGLVLEPTMIAIEIKLETGTFYLPAQPFDHGKVLIPDGAANGQHVLTPGEVRVNWDAWVGDLARPRLLTAEELAAQHPGIVVDLEN
jgi:hypothetical protein